jgi:hypothetical protein
MRRGLKKIFVFYSNFLCRIMETQVATKHTKATALIGATPNQEVEGMEEGMEEGIEETIVEAMVERVVEGIDDLM